MRSLLVYGNCQASTIVDTLAYYSAASELFRIVYVTSLPEPLGNQRPLTKEDFSDCAILCEQVDWEEFPYRDRLPQGCPTIRFPSLDSVALWPFNCENPYNVPTGRNHSGRFPYGDRVILRKIDSGMSGEEVLSFYLNGWNDYKCNMDRIRELDRVRLQKRDERCDVTGSDLILNNFVGERLFMTINHPRETLLARLLERLLDACSLHEPALRRIDAYEASRTAHEADPYIDIQVPVHPQIAQALELAWYDPNALYQQYGGFNYSYSEYFENLITYSIQNRRKQLMAKLPPQNLTASELPLRGTAAPSKAVSGYFPDGFIGERLRFELTAHAPVSNLSVQGFCPVMHEGPLVLDLAVGEIARASAEVTPGAVFTLSCDVSIGAGQSVNVELKSSRVFNLLERGESEDYRDLSVLLFSVDAR